jgi:GNAT superfamily N-acetyltransferase
VTFVWTRDAPAEVFTFAKQAGGTIGAMKIELTPWEHPDGEVLRARQRAEVAELLGAEDTEPGAKPSAEDVAAFFVVRLDDGTAVGCGGLRDLGGGVGEVKRMYADPAHRGRGVSVLVLETLEGWAREAGWTSLRLETAFGLPAAVRFYTRSGFQRIENFGPYAGVGDSVCYEKAL